MEFAFLCLSSKSGQGGFSFCVRSVEEGQNEEETAISFSSAGHTSVVLHNRMTETETERSLQLPVKGASNELSS